MHNEISLDPARLENVKRRADGSIKAACPACRAVGSDKSGQHLQIQPNGKFGCVTHPRDGEHRKEIFRLAGSRIATTPPKPAGAAAPSGKPQFVCAYDYLDGNGKLIFQKVRKKPKSFSQRRPDGKHGWIWNLDGVEKVLFRLPEIRRAVQRGHPIFICEGEKDCQAMAQQGFDATCNSEGAVEKPESEKWLDSYTETLRGADVCIIPDKDPKGREHARIVAGKLHGVAKSVRVIELPDTNGHPVKDAADFFAAGGEAGKIGELYDAAPLWTPPGAAMNFRRADVAREYLSAEEAEKTTAAAGGGEPGKSSGATVLSITPLDDAGAGEFEFANALAANLPPIKTVGSDWFAYETGAWQKIHRATLRPAAQQILPENIRTARREASLLDHLQGRWQVAPDAFRGFHRFDDARAILINAQNGIVRVSAGCPPELLPHAKEHLFRHRTAAKFDPQARADLFKKVLGDSLPDELDRDLMQLCFGNFLLPDCCFEVALVCYGEASCGKSTIAEPVAAALGGDLVARLSMSQICDAKSYHLHNLELAAVNLGTELDVIAIDESQNFKLIVSGEQVETRPIYGEPFKMKTNCKLWFLANGLPRFKNGTEAELRRTRFIRFDKRPKVLDVTLKTRLQAELDGVFNFMLEGLSRLLTLPEIPLGGAESQAVHARFKISNDPLGAFVNQHCQLDPAVRETKTAIKSAFDGFCETHGLPMEFGDWFFKRLYERFTNLAEIRASIGGERVRCVSGIRLKTIVETE